MAGRPKGSTNKKMITDKKEDDSNKKKCNCCGKERPMNKFYESETYENMADGVIPICMDCCNNLFYDTYRHYKKIDSLEDVNGLDITDTSLTVRVFDKVCRILNLPFKYEAYNQTMTQINTYRESNKNLKNVFGIYKSKITTICKQNNRNENFLSYDDSDVLNEDREKIAKENIESNKENMLDDDIKQLQLFWGKGLNRDDYEYLEMELAEWKNSAKCDNKSELVLLKEICLKQLDIRIAREQGRDVDKLQKGLQDLMKTASIDPAKSSLNSSTKASESYGAWVKDIETKTPAEWHKDQEKYKDMDGLSTYLTNFVKRPILNFLSGTRNFELIGEKFDGRLDDEEKDGE